MNFLEMQQHVAQMIGDEDYVQFKLPQIKRYLNMGQKYVAGQLECVHTSISGSSLDNVTNRPGGVNLSDLFLRVHDVRVTSEGTLLFQIPWQNAFAAPIPNSIVDPGNPYAFYITPQMSTLGVYARRLEFYPAQPRVKSLAYIVNCIAYPADLVADVDVSPLPSFLHEAIALYALSRCKMQENDYEGAKFIMDMDVKERLLDAQFELGPSTSTQYGTITDVSSVSSPIFD